MHKTTIRKITPDEQETVLRLLKESALWLKEQKQPGNTVLSNSPYVRFYAEMPGMVLVTSNPTAWNDIRLAADGNRFVVFDCTSQPFRSVWPQELAEHYAPVEVPGVSAKDIQAMVLRSHPIVRYE